MLDWLKRRWTGRDRLEQRSGYSDSLLALAEAHVAGTAQAGDVHLTAAATAAAGLWGRSLAAATVSPAGQRTAGLTPEVLDLIGRMLVRRGEIVLLLEVEAGEAKLMPACDWEVHGDPHPATWTYTLTTAGPDNSRTIVVGADSVIHARWNCSPAAPWRGRSPLATAATSAALAGYLELRAKEESSAQVGRVIPVPDTTATGDVQAGLAAMAGKTMLVPSAATGWPDGTVGTPRSDWVPHRLGANPPPEVVQLRQDAQRAVYTACGIPTELLEAGEGGQSREALRRFLHSALVPTARLLEAECSAKLEADVRFDFEALFASDVMGRARSLGSLVQAGVRGPVAAQAAGFEFGEEDFQPAGNAGNANEDQQREYFAEAF